MKNINLLTISSPIFRELYEFSTYYPFDLLPISIPFMSTIIPIK